jgi:GH43 family beta-xylosidase
MIKISDLRIRDPFVLTDFDNGCYYLGGTIDLLQTTMGTHMRFSLCKTYDLENLEEPKVIFDGSGPDFWATCDFWAPEIHKYKGKYYLFGSVKAKGVCRGTQIFVCDTPDGQYRPLSDMPVTPADWECLDGTLFVDGDVPYIVFCHEWLQVGNGTICERKLSQDLTTALTEPRVLFCAQDYADAKQVGRDIRGYVTDGPFLYRRKNGKLICIWSTTTPKGYVELISESDNGDITGNWTVSQVPLSASNGGHGMFFTDFRGNTRFIMHKPNSPVLAERPVIQTLIDREDTLLLV